MSLSYMNELPQRPASMVEQHEQKLGQRLTLKQLLEVDKIWREGEDAKLRAERAASAVSATVVPTGSEAPEARGEGRPSRGREA